MKARNLKLFLGFFVLLIYMSIGVFGLLKLDHTAETPMVNCPYAQNGSALCENSFDHINNWQQFSNATFYSFLIFSLLILGIVLYFFGKQNFLKQKQYFYRWRYYLDNKNSGTYLNKITKWLSLFENSPSLSYRA